MAKRRMRRTGTSTQAARNARSLTEGFVDQARAASAGMVDIATDAARAALSGMQQVGRAMAGMSAARRGMSAAADAGRATGEGVRDAARGMTANAGRPARRATATQNAGSVGRPSRYTSQKTIARIRATPPAAARRNDRIASPG